MRGLYIGRFQPYHLGHQAVLRGIAEEMDEIVIVIGSAQESHTVDNPFTAGERMEMIYGALEECGLRSRCYVIALQDVKRNSIWVSHLQSMVPRFNVVYSNNPLVARLFSEAGIKLKNPPMFHRERYSGTAIRQMMLLGDIWQDLVPRSVAEFIVGMNGIERLSRVASSDNLNV